MSRTRIYRLIMRCERIVQVLVTMLQGFSLLIWRIVAVTVSFPNGPRGAMDQGLIQARGLWCQVWSWLVMGQHVAAVPIYR
jgi:hypothetical protein